MFGPEYQNMNCPKCRYRKVYFDREIGYYCMFCGHEVSAEEIEALVQNDCMNFAVDSSEKAIL